MIYMKIVIAIVIITIILTVLRKHGNNEGVLETLSVFIASLSVPMWAIILLFGIDSKIYELYIYYLAIIVCITNILLYTFNCKSIFKYIVFGLLGLSISLVCALVIPVVWFLWLA